MKMNPVFLLIVLFAMGTFGENSTWPLHVSSGGDRIAVYPPQPDSLNDGVLSARAALVVIPDGQSNAVYGVMRLEARAVHDSATQMVALKSLHVVDIRMADLLREKEVQFAAALALHACTWTISFSQDALNAMLELAGPSDAEPLQMPRTAAVPRDAQLEVTYDGSPCFEPIEQTDLQGAVNTDFQVIRDEARYYCADRGVWYTAPSPNGPWKAADCVSDKIRKIPPTSRFHHTRFLYVGDQSEDQIHYGFYPGYLRGNPRGVRFGGWGIDYESPDYSIRVDPGSGSIYYREKSNEGSQSDKKSWKRDVSKFPEFEK